VSFLVFAAQVRAQSLDPSRRISQYGHTTWRTQDGVVSVFTPITQTADGYVWMAAPGLDSLVRFDGVRFVPWHPSTGSFPSKVNFLLGARDGSLWIGTRGGLGRLKDGVFSTYSGPGDKSGVNEMLEDRQGTIWFTRYRIPPGEGALCRVEGSGLRCFGPSDGLAARFALGLTEDPEGYLWFAAESLYRWKPGTRPTRYFESTSHPLLASVAADRAGNVWATMDEAGKNLGVRYFHDGAWGEYSTPDFTARRSSPRPCSSIAVAQCGSAPTMMVCIASSMEALIIFPRRMD
jgi:ligand-binding sensor domain-containing protein